MPTKPTDFAVPAGRDLATLIAPEAVYPMAAGGAGPTPVAVYLARLAPGSRPAMRGALKSAARLLTGLDDPPWERLPWWELRRPHLAALRAALAERCAPAFANKILSAVRGVLKEAMRLDLMTAEEFTRTADVANVKGSRPLRGRALTHGELHALFAACADDSSVSRVRCWAARVTSESQGRLFSEPILFFREGITGNGEERKNFSIISNRSGR